MKFLDSLIERALTCLGLLFYNLGLARVVIWMNRHTPRVLVYHAFDERESDFIEGRSINTTPAHFRAQLRFLEKHYRIVPMSDFAHETLPDCALLITFDDGFRSVYSQAFPLLEVRGLPATCYLSTDVIGNRSLIWTHELNWYFHRHLEVAGPLVSQRVGLAKDCSANVLLNELIARFDRDMIRDLLMELRDRVGTTSETLAQSARLYIDRLEIEEMSRNGFSFGNHSGSHPVFSRISDDECRGEISRAGEVIDTLPGSIPSFAYPFGSWNEATRRIALELGYVTALEVGGNNNPIDPHRVRRLNVTSISPGVLFARMELVTPLKSRTLYFLNRMIDRFRLVFNAPAIAPVQRQ
jgi:peptidoglycan/xylan/chitin deacetylase (PgdA/CDA1 family)